MSTISYTLLLDSSRNKVVQWGPMATGDVGNPYPHASHFEAQSVQVYGTFTGATVTMQGTNEVAATPSYWENLPDAANASLTFTTEGFKGIGAVSSQIRPSVASGSGSGLYVLLCLKAI
jgi:hypothetical protein